MRRAVIDIGTNTVKLLVADVQDGQVQPVVSKDATTRLGEGVEQTKRLSQPAIARTIEVIKRYIADASELGAESMVAITTSAVRDAANRDEFLNAVGIDIQVLSGEQEAESIFRGVCTDQGWSKQQILVMDVGGGSAEFILGNSGVIERRQSLPLGAVRLTERFRDAGFAELAAFLRRALRDALQDYHTGSWRMIGTGGTITTLAHMKHGKIDHAALSLDDLRVLVTSLDAMTLGERKRVPRLPPERADIIVAGGAVYLFAMEALDAFELTVSVRNLRYGVLV